MKFYLNRLFIPELEIMKAFNQYLADIDIRGLYKRVTVSVTNDHPFAQLTNGLISNNGKVNTSGVFPAIVITTAGEGKSAKLGLPVDARAVKCEDTDGLEDYLATPKVLQDMGDAISKNGYLCGAQYLFRRKDDISIEIWAENIQLKNELYDISKMFVLNIRKTALERFVERNAIAVFDESIRGDRSNNYNFDFGTTLAGANIAFEIEYCNEIIILDSEITDENIEFLARNHDAQDAATTPGMIPEQPPMMGG
jgi:hypothetical protein